eukprot:scaffold94974_cov60-Phaeocystis_antarctica.AAC.10
MRRASATGLLDNLGGEGQPLPESHGRDSSMGQAAIQQPRRVGRRGPGAQRPSAQRPSAQRPSAQRPSAQHSPLAAARLWPDYSTHCEHALQPYTAMFQPLHAGTTRRPRRGGEGPCCVYDGTDNLGYGFPWRCERSCGSLSLSRSRLRADRSGVCLRDDPRQDEPAHCFLPAWTAPPALSQEPGVCVVSGVRVVRVGVRVGDSLQWSGFIPASLLVEYSITYRHNTINY